MPTMTSRGGDGLEFELVEEGAGLVVVLLVVELRVGEVGDVVVEGAEVCIVVGAVVGIAADVEVAVTLEVPSELGLDEVVGVLGVLDVVIGS